MASAVSSLFSGSGNERFNAEAAAWDQNPFVHAASGEAWKAIQRLVPAMGDDQKRTADVLEIGCGTGLLSFLVAEKARQVVAVDAAHGMIDVLKQKIEKAHVKNIVPVCVLLEDPEDKALPAGEAGGRLKFHLITSHLVMHHIPELKPVIKTMFGCLKPGGMVALTDFEDFGPEAKRFHAESRMAGVERHGINKQAITSLLNEAGFTDVNVVVGWEADKKVEKFPGEYGKKGRPEEGQGEIRTFPFLVCMGKKPSS